MKPVSPVFDLNASKKIDIKEPRGKYTEPPVMVPFEDDANKKDVSMSGSPEKPDKGLADKSGADD